MTKIDTNRPFISSIYKRLSTLDNKKTTIQILTEYNGEIFVLDTTGAGGLIWKIIEEGRVLISSESTDVNVGVSGSGLTINKEGYLLSSGGGSVSLRHKDTLSTVINSLGLNSSGSCITENLVFYTDTAGVVYCRDLLTFDLVWSLDVSSFMTSPTYTSVTANEKREEIIAFQYRTDSTSKIVLIDFDGNIKWSSTETHSPISVRFYRDGSFVFYDNNADTVTKYSAYPAPSIQWTYSYIWDTATVTVHRDSIGIDDDGNIYLTLRDTAQGDGITLSLTSEGSFRWSNTGTSRAGIEIPIGVSYFFSSDADLYTMDKSNGTSFGLFFELNYTGQILCAYPGDISLY